MSDLAINNKYKEFAGTLANAVGQVTTTPDGVGKYGFFQGGAIYWTSATGAHIVWGDIRNKWVSMGAEKSLLGYPVTDELTSPNGRGRYNHFQGGTIYWTPETGARYNKTKCKTPPKNGYRAKGPSETSCATSI